MDVVEPWMRQCRDIAVLVQHVDALVDPATSYYGLVERRQSRDASDRRIRQNLAGIPVEQDEPAAE